MQTDIKYIRDSIDELKQSREKQDIIINTLQTNCNREERWDNIRDKVDSNETRIGACEDRIDALENIHNQDAGAKQAMMSHREMVSWALTGILAFITIFQFLKGEL